MARNYYRRKSRKSSGSIVDIGMYSDWSADNLTVQIEKINSELSPIRTAREELAASRERAGELLTEKHQKIRQLVENHPEYKKYKNTNSNAFSHLGTLIGFVLFVGPLFYWAYADFETFIQLIFPILFFFGGIYIKFGEAIIEGLTGLFGLVGQRGKDYPTLETELLKSPPQALQNISSNSEKLEKKILSLSEEVERTVTRYGQLKTELKILRAAKKQASKKERSARLAAYDGKARQGSQSLKKQMLYEVKGRTKKCPYCGTQTAKADLVLDHIHPIAKGGQTVIQNSVLICQPCNSSKRAMTLRSFCKKAGLDPEAVAAKLEKQGKWV